MSAADSGGFVAGDWVMVTCVHPPGHRRTPFYVRGKIGLIERSCGTYANPEELSYGWSGMPGKRLYRVRFLQRELWPDYDGRAEDTVDIDIYEHWLRPVAGGGTVARPAREDSAT